VPAVRRKLTATTAVVLALVAAGCGKDSSSSDTTAQSASTQATTAATTPTTTAPAKKTSGTKKASGSKKSSSSTTSGSKTSTTTTPAAKKKTTTPKPAATKKTKKTPSVPTGVTPKQAAPTPGADPSPGSGGSGSTADRLAVVATLRRYYKAFIDKDGAAACALLTTAGKAVMNADGGGKTCPDSVKRLIKQTSENNIALLVTTRDGIHVNDVDVNGNTATAQIGKTSRLNLVQENGKWLLKSPNVEATKA
jgi:hypothetical protein